MKRYKCPVCGWIYDPEIGDESAGIPPGVDFNDLPEGYACPVCGSPHDDFEEYE